MTIYSSSRLCCFDRYILWIAVKWIPIYWPLIIFSSKQLLPPVSSALTQRALATAGRVWWWGASQPPSSSSAASPSLSPSTSPRMWINVSYTASLVEAYQVVLIVNCINKSEGKYLLTRDWCPPSLYLFTKESNKFYQTSVRWWDCLVFSTLD